jgi:hypothetical protein
MLQTLTVHHTQLSHHEIIFQTITEKPMNRIFKSSLLALSLASVALLSACGGGGSTSTTPEQAQVQPAWGSPAMFVPAGQSQISVTVSGCEENSRAIRLNVSGLEQAARSNGNPVGSPTLVITSAGDVVFSGVLSGSSTVAELVRLNFADTSDRAIEFNSDATQNRLYVENNTGTEIGVRYDGGTQFLTASNAAYRIVCNQGSNLTPAYPPSEARLAAKFTAGATSWANNSVRPFTTTTIANSLITWNNQAVSTSLDTNQVSARYASLNVATGAINVGPNSGQVTQSVAISAATAAGGKYSEEDYIDRDFAQGRAKSVGLSISTAGQGVLKFGAYTGDNIIIVQPSLGNPIFLPPVIPLPQ